MSVWRRLALDDDGDDVIGKLSLDSSNDVDYLRTYVLVNDAYMCSCDEDKLRWLAETLKNDSPFRPDSETNESPLRTYQLWKKNFYEESHKLDDMTELPKSQPKKTYDKNLKSEIVMVKIPRCLRHSGGGLILYQAYGNLYTTTGREAHLPEDKQISSVGVFDEVTWMAFGGNTRDLGSFGEETDEITTLHQSQSRKCVQTVETASKLLVTPSGYQRDSVRIFEMASRLGKRVAKAIKEYEKTRANLDNTRSSGGYSENAGGTVNVQGCSHKIFMNGKPHPFNGTQGVVGLRCWIEKVEQVFEIFKCAEEDKVMFAASTFEGRALTWWNGNVHTLGLINANSIPWTEFKTMMTTEYCPAIEIQRMEQELWTLTFKGDDIEAYNNHFHELVLMCPELVSTEKKNIEKYIRGLPEGVKGNVTSSKPATLHDAINMARELIEQGVQARELRIGESNKRKWEDQQGNNHHQQQNQRQEAAKAYVAASAEGKGYTGNLPWCNRCKAHHQSGSCPPSCGEKGHYRDKCPRGRNSHNEGARGGAYVMRTGEPQQDPNTKLKRRNFVPKTKTFEENCDLLPYAVSSKEDMAYQRQLITRIRVKMDDPNITMEEYIRLEEEKARRRGKVYNWETAKYGKIWYDEDVHDLKSIETEFPTIVFNDALTSEVTHSCEPMVSPLNNNKIDFRILFDEYDDEDYTVFFDKNSFSYKIIYANDLKTDSENDNEKVNMPSLPPPKPTVSYFDDFDFFKDFENEFPVIVYNDALTSKSDFSTEPVVIPQHVDEFDLKDEASLSEYDKEEQNVLYFNDLFSFNIISPDDSKSNEDNDDDKSDIEHSSGNLSVKPLPDVINTDVGTYAHRYQYDESWGMDTAYRLPVQF
ncbi:putative reverse transcriptase domain-containing protein [Tanacetum coccineum]